MGYRNYDRSGTEPLFSLGHSLGYTDWTYESLAPVAEAITAGQDLPLLVTVRNSSEGTAREVAQGYWRDRTTPAARSRSWLASPSLTPVRPVHSPASTRDCPSRSGTLGSTGCTSVGRRGTSGRTPSGAAMR